MLMSIQAPCPSSLSFLLELDLFKLRGSGMPRASTVQVRDSVHSGCRVNAAGSVAQIPAPSLGTHISEKGCVTFSKILLFAKYPSTRERPSLYKSVFTKEKAGRRWDSFPLV